MRFLVCNDDGYNAIGIKVLKEKLSKYGEVIVSAPKVQQSGFSTSMSIYRTPLVERLDNGDLIVDGTPADCAILGLKYYKDLGIDMIFSGINNGYNLAQDTIYSGTIGVCNVSYIYNIPCVALSCNDKIKEDIEEKTEFILEYIFKNALYKDFKYLSINYPDPSVKCLYEVKPAKTYKLQMRYDGFIDETLKDPVDCDRYQVMRGYYSISPFKANFLDEESYEKLVNKMKKGETK